MLSDAVLLLQRMCSQQYYDRPRNGSNMANLYLKKEKFMPFSDGNGNLLRRQPSAVGKAIEQLEEHKELLCFNLCAVCCSAKTTAETKAWANLSKGWLSSQ